MQKLAWLVFMIGSFATGQTVTVTASHLQNASGQLISGYVYLQPTLTSGQPTWYRSPGGGTVSSAAVPVPVVNGVLSVTLPDTTQTYPANLCFTMTYPQGSLATGYNCLQPHATAYNSSDWCQAGVCNLDNYLPGNQPLPTINAVSSINYTAGNLTFTGSGFSQSGNTFTFPAGAGLSLTTTGTSGASTLSGGILNVPQYQAALGYTPAHSGANSDITSLTGLTTPLSVLQGGTGQNSLVPTTPVTTTPSGSCAQGAPNQQDTVTGIQYSCQNVVSGVGTWGAVSGSGWVTIAPSGDTTGNTDCVNIQTQCANGKHIMLEPGTYYVGGGNTSCTLSNVCSVTGQGPSQTVFQNEGTTNDVIVVNAANAGGTLPPYPSPLASGGDIGAFTIIEDSSLTPTAGAGLRVGTNGTGVTFGYNFSNIDIKNTYRGLQQDPGFWRDTFEHMTISNSISQNCVYLDSPSPNGDGYYDDMMLIGDSVGTPCNFYINRSDSNRIHSIKFNIGKFIFGTGSGGVSNLTFSDSGVEGAATCAFDFSAGSVSSYGMFSISNIEWEPTGSPMATYPVCGAQNVGRLAVSNMCLGSYAGAPSKCFNYPIFRYAVYDDFNGFSGTILGDTESNNLQTWAQTFANVWGNTLSLNGSGSITTAASTDISVYNSGAALSSPDYTVSVPCTLVSGGAGWCAAWGRLTPSISTTTGYSCLFVEGAGVELLSWSGAGVNTQIGTTYAGITEGTHRIALVLRGSNISCSLDGAAVSGPSGTDTTYTAAGYAGVGVDYGTVSPGASANGPYTVTVP